MSRRALAARVAPLALLVILAIATLLPLDERLRLESGDPSVADRWAEALDALPGGADVLVGFDPDLGTYAEVRPTVRSVLAELLDRGHQLAFVSLTPEGRALALAEAERLVREGAPPQDVADLGFVPGAEAALVSLTRTLPQPVVDDALGRRLADEGLAGVEAILVVGGNDLGPRSWVEQVATRVEGVPLLAIAPTVLLPELLPFVATGQLEALVATPRDGATLRASVDFDATEDLATTEGPSTAALLLGTAVAILVLGQALVAGVTRGPSSREAG